MATAKTMIPAAIHTRRRPKADRVRSHSMPHTGNAISPTTPARPLMMPKSWILCGPSRSASWLGSNSWIGTSQAIQNPNQSRVNRAVQPLVTGTTGSVLCGVFSVVGPAAVIESSSEATTFLLPTS